MFKLPIVTNLPERANETVEKRSGKYKGEILRSVVGQETAHTVGFYQCCGPERTTFHPHRVAELTPSAPGNHRTEELHTGCDSGRLSLSQKPQTKNGSENENSDRFLFLLLLLIFFWLTS